jgi:hypothetical protein
MAMSEAPSSAPTKPPVSIPWLISLTVLIGAITFSARLWWIEPSFPRIAPKGIAVLPFAAIFAFGTALILCLAYANRNRWRAVLRPSWGRVIGAVVLLVVTPVAVFAWLPSILGFAIGIGIFVVLGEGGWDVDLEFLALLIVPVLIWYPVSCLIVSGVSARWVRVALFCLLFWSAYSAVILTLGTMKFQL